jgi:hypothetical protein
MKRSDFSYFQGRTLLDWARSRGLVTVCLIAWAAAVSILVFLDTQSVYRAPVVLSFLLLAPGLALVRLLRLQDLLMELSLAIALSLAVDAIVATLFLYANAWSLESIFLVLALLTLVSALADLIQSHK